MHVLGRSASETCCGCYKIARYCIVVRCLSKPNFIDFDLQQQQNIYDPWTRLNHNTDCCWIKA